MKTWYRIALLPTLSAAVIALVALGCNSSTSTGPGVSNNGGNNVGNNIGTGDDTPTCTSDSSCGEGKSCQEGLCTSVCADSQEPNDSPASAVVVTESTVFENLEICEFDEDYFAFTLPPGGDGVVSVTFSNAAGDIDLQVLKADGSSFGSSETNLDEEKVLIPSVDVETTFVVKVFGFQDSANTYSIDLKVDPEGSVCENTTDCFSGFTCNDNVCDPPPLCDDPNEVNNDISVATPLADGQTIDDANICQSTDIDWYRFEVADGGTDAYVAVEFSSVDADIDASLFDDNNVELDLSDSFSSNEYLSSTGLNPGAYYVRVTTFNDREADYAISLTLNPDFDLCEAALEPCDGGLCTARRVCLPEDTCEVDQDCDRFDDTSAPYCVGGQCACEDAYEPNDTMEAATDLDGLDTTGVLLSTCDGNDWFTFSAEQGDDVTIDVLFNANFGDLEINILDAAGDVIAQGRSSDDNEQGVLEDVDAGDYFIHVFIRNDVEKSVPYYISVSTE